MPLGNSGVPELQKNRPEKPDDSSSKNEEDVSKKETLTNRTENANEKKESPKVGSISSSLEIAEAKAKAKAKENRTSQGSMEASSKSNKTTKDDTSTSGGPTDITKGSLLSKTASNQSKPFSKTAAVAAAAPPANAPVVVRETSDPKLDSNAFHTKKETTEPHSVTKPVVKTTTTTTTTTSTSAVTAPKQSQQNSHSKQHTQQQRYFVPSRQNQEEAVFKMVQNIFKLLETRGPLTMAQLEYNLPIMISGSPSSLPLTPQPMNATGSKMNATGSEDPNGAGEKGKEAIDATTVRTSSMKKEVSTTSFYEEKLIPGNMVPDIVELLVTLGVIQQQISADDISSGADASGGSHKHESMKTKNQPRKQPRFAVHFGKPKQFLVTPINILSEIAKAQAEIQLSRTRQELLQEALNMTDEQAAERVKHIVLQHPQVVDDPVYVTALRNLHIDGMLMAGISGTSPGGTANTSSSQTVGNSVGKTKSGIGRSRKKNGGVKRRQSSGTTAKRKRPKSKKDHAGSTDADNESGKSSIAPSSDVAVSSKQNTPSVLPSSTSISDTPSSTQPIKRIASVGTNSLEST